MIVAGGLCTTVSTTGITTAGVPFNDCATWVVVADRNLEKPGDKHLVENILDERFQAKNSRHLTKLNFYNMADNICVTFTHNAVQVDKKPLTGAVNQITCARKFVRHFRSFV